ncbi:MAG TPA: tryptophan synthase subunit beta like protein [Alphaproteobacteria bacterium]|nr:tryptophan synthase subunit beta like protein [Alphaproteobacteria bacterium]
MPFIRRDSAGAIIDTCDHAQSDAIEFLDAEDPEVLRFIAGRESNTDIKEQLNISDIDMARVVEDLVEVLIAKGTITTEDLPEIVRLKLRRRRELRRSINTLGRLIADEE